MDREKTPSNLIERLQGGDKEASRKAVKTAIQREVNPPSRHATDVDMQQDGGENVGTVGRSKVKATFSIDSVVLHNLDFFWLSERRRTGARFSKSELVERLLKIAMEDDG